MHRRPHRTYRLTRRILTLHAWHGLEVDAGIGRIAFVIRINADPLHLPAALYLLFADDRDIVLRLARHRARLTSDAGIQVNGHAPGIIGIRHVPIFLAIVRVKRFRLSWFILRFFFGIFMSKPWGFYELFQVRNLHRLTFVHAEVTLGDGDVPVAIGHVDLGATANVLRCAGTNFVSIVTRARSNSSGASLAVAEEERHRIVGMAGLRPVRRVYFAAIRENNLNNPLRI